MSNPPSQSASHELDRLIYEFLVENYDHNLSHISPDTIIINGEVYNSTESHLVARICEHRGGALQLSASILDDSTTIRVHSVNGCRETLLYSSETPDSKSSDQIEIKGREQWEGALRLALLRCYSKL